MDKGLLTVSMAYVMVFGVAALAFALIILGMALSTLWETWPINWDERTYGRHLGPKAQVDLVGTRRKRDIKEFLILLAMGLGLGLVGVALLWISWWFWPT
jgi:hypothetical protein